MTQSANKACTTMAYSTLLTFLWTKFFVDHCFKRISLNRLCNWHGLPYKPHPHNWHSISHTHTHFTEFEFTIYTSMFIVKIVVHDYHVINMHRMYHSTKNLYVAKRQAIFVIHLFYFIYDISQENNNIYKSDTNTQ